MDPDESARVRLEQAMGLAAVLDVAYNAFEEMLSEIENQQDRGGEAFAALVMSGSAAASARDALAAAPSLPLGTSRDLVAPAALPSRTRAIEHDTAVLATLSKTLWSQLTEASDLSTDVGDRVACTEAARHAATIWSLLGPAPEP